MASQYEAEQKSFYNDCKADGGPVTILRPNASQLDTSDPTSLIPDPSQWMGSNADPLESDTFAIFYPGSSNTAPYTICLLPAFGLDFEVTSGMLIRNGAGKVSQLENATPTDIDGQCIIYYTCTLGNIPNLSGNV